MNIVRSWRELKIMLKWKFPFLSDEDLDFEIGDDDNMLKKLSVKIDKTQSELEALLMEFQRY